MVFDYDSEISLLSCLLRGSIENYYDVVTIGIEETSFYDISHQIFYKVFSYLFEKDQVQQLDKALVKSAASTLGYKEWLQDSQDTFDMILGDESDVQNILEFAKKIKKLQVARNIVDSAEKIKTDAASITGEEKISDIFGIVEKELSNVSQFLTNTPEEPTDFSASIDDHIKALTDNPVDQMGIPSGFPIYDRYIGGGLRRHAITIVGARPKCGKSTFCRNIGYNVASQGIPVLYFDTEMETEDQLNRMVASVSQVDLNVIETGQFGANTLYGQRVEDAADKIREIKFKHKNISGMSLEGQLSHARKWIIRDVGLNNKGKAHDCLLIYDYLKLMDTKDLNNLQEYQAVGFLITTLQNFAVKYDIPILTAVQLNRDGISTEDTSVISGSDRIAMYGSSISILKYKSEEELAKERGEFGNQKLVPLITRYGPKMPEGSYINIDFNLPTNTMTERTVREVSQNENQNQIEF